jgi:hypothetical protein
MRSQFGRAGGSASDGQASERYGPFQIDSCLTEIISGEDPHGRHVTCNGECVLPAANFSYSQLSDDTGFAVSHVSQAALSPAGKP